MNTGSQGNNFNDATKRKFENEEVNDLFEFLTNFKNKYFTRIIFEIIMKIKDS